MTLDQYEKLIGFNLKPVEEPYSQFIKDKIDIEDNIKIAVLEYGIKNCGRRYPREKQFLERIDYENIISFDDLFNFEYLLIFWYNDYIITDMELYYIKSDFKVLKQDYDFIKEMINDGQAYKISEGDTRFLGAGLVEGKSKAPNSLRLARNRAFVLKKKYLQKIIDELGYKCRV